MRVATSLRAVLLSLALLAPGVAAAQDGWGRPSDPYPPPPRSPDAYRPAEPYRAPADSYGQASPYGAPAEGYGAPRTNDAYRPPAPSPAPAPRPTGPDRYEYGYDRYSDPPPAGRGYGSDPPPRGGYAGDMPVRPGPEPYDRGYDGRGYNDRGPPGYEPPPQYGERAPAPYSRNEILDAGHSFFGSISQGLAGAIEYAFQQAGRPNGYILGEDAGGAFVAGLRYGEGYLHTKDAGRHRVYWQGPSLGYDFGGEGSKTMVLVYNMRDVSEIYNRFGGVQGSAYVVGGVSLQFQKYGDVVLAPIRAGVGLRLGANVGYLKYTRTPTWNPF